MRTKKSLQLFLVIAVVAASLMATSPAFASSCGTSYTVVSGDTLRIIAANCGTTVYALRRANPEVGYSDLIYPGQVLLLPGAWIDQGNGYALYIIARGDTLRLLASRFGTSVDVLLSLNTDIYNPNVIYEGQRLSVPSGSGVPVPPPPRPEPVPSGAVYTVQWGDTMRKIADRFGVSLADLIAANPQIWNPNWIFAGQRINLPATASVYTVQRGDTLRIIAGMFGTSVDSLLALNPQIRNPNVIYVGQVIRIW
ncbi:MAG: LysM peptidoglycan-binding domain-containing protein [Bacteroidota bacterium]